MNTATYNNVNELTARSGGGVVRFSGSTDEEAVVTVDGQATQTSAGGTTFSKDLALSPGTHTITVTAEDPSRNLATQDSEIAVTGGTGQSFTYDANGNTTGDGLRTYVF